MNDGLPDMKVIWPGEDRLVVATGSTLRFSAHGDHETFAPDDWVSVYPNDGEDITSLSTDGSFVIAEKPSRKFIFYGVVDEDIYGQPAPPVFCYVYEWRRGKRAA